MRLKYVRLVLDLVHESYPRHTRRMCDLSSISHENKVYYFEGTSHNVSVISFHNQNTGVFYVNAIFTRKYQTILIGTNEIRYQNWF